MEKEYGLIKYSSKSEGKRIAYYEEIISADDYIKISEYRDILKNEFEKIITFPRHFISVDSIKNLHSKDPFFENIELISDFNLFRDKVKKDQKVYYIDLAKLALQYKEYSSLYLQNIMYFIDSIYTIVYEKKFIEENFIVYKHGPMLNSFYSDFKYMRSRPLIKLSEKDRLSMYSRLIQLDGGVEALEISKEVYERYGCLSNTKIYDQGHHESSAWTYHAKKHGITSKVPISKEDILKHEKSFSENMLQLIKSCS